MQRPWGAGNHGALEEVKDTVAGPDGTKAGWGLLLVESVRTQIHAL